MLSHNIIMQPHNMHTQGLYESLVYVYLREWKNKSRDSRQHVQQE